MSIWQHLRHPCAICSIFASQLFHCRGIVCDVRIDRIFISGAFSIVKGVVDILAFGVFGGFAMRDLASKMAELKFEAPLAQFEETDEWGSTEFQSANLKNENEINNININNKKKDINDVLNDLNEDILNNSNPKVIPNKTIILKNGDTASVADNFTETFSGSLEDLVNTFDDKITKCFGNYEESVENLAPVQIRSQEEIMNECQ